MTGVNNVGAASGPSLPVPADWPRPPAEEAFHGIAGDFVRLVEPHTEADPVAVLLQFLVAFGSLVGRGPHMMVGADRHGTNLFAVLVGITAKGRKGTSWSLVCDLLRRIDPDWADKCIKSGLSSGEGLIHAVRDPLEVQEPVKKAGKVIEYQQVVQDPGVADKRLLVVEGEFALPLKNLARDTNTLSAVIRNAWDRGDLRVLTKTSPTVATGAHISILGHTTKEELLRYLSETEVANGFGNRFMWVMVRRSKVLPEPGRPEDAAFAELVGRAAETLKYASTVHEMRKGDAARDLWRHEYPSLSRALPGMLGAMTARAEAQVLRLALIYALLDRSAIILEPHLRSALGLWQYAQASARCIFGFRLGDPTADTILTALLTESRGLSRTQIRDLFNRNAKTEDTCRALNLLRDAGLVTVAQEDSGGRPVEVWRAATT